jgi:hypothetical protein
MSSSEEDDCDEGGSFSKGLNLKPYFVQGKFSTLVYRRALEQKSNKYC